MKVTVIISLLLLAVTGCGPADTELSTKADSGFNQLSAYGPVKVYIMPLTEFAAGDDETPSKIKVYVSLLDAFDCQMKTPAVFRFELYERVPRSAEPKGERILIWPDIDLKNPAKNNEYWMDFLRAYEFDLPFEPETSKSCILQVTALCQDGKRLSAEFTLK
ncbi:MAG: hypothetical protein WC454_07550 [Phycisphaerae bacterium]|jgi:hypothetical protein